jgi:hypothetical protein
MSNLAKCQSLAMKLKSNLDLRVASKSWTISEATDAKGALLIMSDSTPDIKVVIRIKALENAHVDILSQHSSYSPSVIQIIEEGALSLSTMDMQVKFALDFEVARMGLSQERYIHANPAQAMMAADGSVSSATAITNLSDINWPLSGQ